MLVIDIGNTSTALGRVTRTGKVQGVRRLGTHAGSVASIRSVVAEVVGKRRTGAAVLSSVVPKRRAVWNRVLQEAGISSRLFVDHETELGVGIDYPKPAQIGADRLANAAGAARRYGLPVVIADFGTALTFDVILEDRGYVGGVIAPGLPLMFDYLSERTALLPRIQPRKTDAPYGRSTEAAMRIGAQVGYRGIVREILAHLADAPEVGDYTVVATGGHAKWVMEYLDQPVVYDKDLTLFGLGVIGDLAGISP